MATTLSSESLALYQQSTSFAGLISLNIDFMNGKIETPYTDGLQSETSPLIESLIAINQLGLLTTNSGTGNTGRAYLIGLVEGENNAERLEVLLNQTDLIAFKLPCNTAGYLPNSDDDVKSEQQADLVKIPISFKTDQEIGETIVNRYVTCFNWFTLLQPCINSTLYESLANHCYNFYIIDPVSKRSALAQDGILGKVKQSLEQLKHK
ncbi:hypothetical protein FDP41_009785 [Naegleria fowleri]|uniref:DUF6919 domain-containing protein n=1 Tax=Naegleria fowleri TaxID=5763 RepID=A0A6A5BGC4_NAEFO|nr:uncharacterized protein FDP41_009785 [Naegleria fowleri]KAF0972089.1 hypothetical protein FDP41_009785 [Naegleria fowleri]CAG4710820.1 unnamed protein product [Naegleria fowleri]